MSDSPKTTTKHAQAAIESPEARKEREKTNELLGEMERIWLSVPNFGYWPDDQLKRWRELKRQAEEHRARYYSILTADLAAKRLNDLMKRPAATKANPKKSKQPPTSRSKEIGRRRKLAQDNLDLPNLDMCELYDRQKILLPKSYGRAHNWAEAYKMKIYKARIASLVYKDKHPPL